MSDLKAAAKFCQTVSCDSFITDEQTDFLVLASQALEAWAWLQAQEMPIEIGKNGSRILGRDADGELKYYYADTPLGAVLAAMDGERDGK